MKGVYIKTKNGGLLNLRLLKEDLKWARDLSWKKTIWTSQSMLYDKKSKISVSYIGQGYDPNHFELVENGNDHEHCDICTEKIYDVDIAYESDNQTICKNCFDWFISTPDVDSFINGLEKIEK